MSFIDVNSTFRMMYLCTVIDYEMYQKAMSKIKNLKLIYVATVHRGGTEKSAKATRSY